MAPATAPPGLADRYGTPSPVRRRVLVGVLVVVVVAFLGWLAWATWFHATPAVESDLVTWEVVGDHETTVTVQVALEEGVSASCVVTAVAEDHTTVGEVAFEPVDGSNDVSVRTERRATSVSLEGCTAPGQPRPQ
jgi:Domain of unknown function (DUF4307)